ncbi:MAG: ABC transporter ATP-binding protein [Desulfococcaceae bacterium]
MELLEVSDLHKAFDDRSALESVSFGLDRGHILCLLGPSGCGKTTLLRLIAGLETPDQGKILFDGKDMTAVPPHLREFGMMFQEYALFPHKNVYENLAFGLEMQGMDSPAIRRHVTEMLELVGMQGFEKRDTALLSGGERQRVALARSLAPRPRLLMLDEPLGSLDRALRERLIAELRKILRQVNVTAIYVTHDQAEAFAIADRIALFNRGKLIQKGTPEELYKSPSSITAARFLGFHNLLDGKIAADGIIETALGQIRSGCTTHRNGESVTVLIPPECAQVAGDSDTVRKEGIFLIYGRVRESIFQGSFYRVHLEIRDGQVLVFHLPNTISRPEPGENLALEADMSAPVCIP